MAWLCEDLSLLTVNPAVENVRSDAADVAGVKSKPMAMADKRG